MDSRRRGQSSVVLAGGQKMRLIDLLCVCLGVRQVQLMGNWTHKSSRPKRAPPANAARRRRCQSPPTHRRSSPPPPLAGRKELNPPIYTE